MAPIIKIFKKRIKNLKEKIPIMSNTEQTEDRGKEL